VNPRYASDPIWAAGDLHEKLHTWITVPLPEPVEAAWQAFNAIIVPAEVSTDDLAHAIADGASAKVIDELARAVIYGPTLRAAALQGKVIAAKRYLAAVRAHAQEIHDLLASSAQEDIDAITEAAKEGSKSLDQLVREGRYDAARLWSELDTRVSQLVAKQLLRDSGIWQIGTVISPAGIDLHQFKRPVSMVADSPVAQGKTSAAYWYNLLVAKNAELHFWAPHRYLAEADKYTEEIARGERDRQRAFAVEHRESVGFMGR
jgi:hypothetical protein